MGARLKYEERTTRAGDDASAFWALMLLDGISRPAMQIAGELVAEQHVGMLDLERAADQQML